MSRGTLRLVTKPSRLELAEQIDIPVVEASDLAVRRTADGETHVIAVGDRNWTIGIGNVVDGAIVGWQTLDVDAVEGLVPHSGDSELEAIAADGGSLVAVVQEERSVVIVVDADRRQVISTITLDEHPVLSGMWDEANARCEGLVLLRGGRLLIAKEKNPAALVEFAPAGAAPAGVSADDLLDPGEPWQPPDGDDVFSAVAMWPLAGEAADHFRDISALGVTRERELCLLSDKSRTIGRLSLDRPLDPAGGKIDTIDEVGRLPKHIDKPEGVAALAPGRFLVASDTKTASDNGFVVTRPAP
jgi:uncharacterized protein YjiK